MPGMAKTTKRPRDPNQLAKLVVDVAAGDVIERENPASSEAAILGRRGGLKGGTARAEAMTPRQRSAVARQVALARWKKSVSD
jgi:hypothetical protein